MDAMQLNLLGPYATCPELLKERQTVGGYYNFYYGACEGDKQYLQYNQDMLGQSWYVDTDLDYTPTEDIRNHVKRIIHKQARFMLGSVPSIVLKAYKPEQRDSVEAFRQFIEDMFDNMGFWTDTYKAFIDSTIGKRVLIRLEANPTVPGQKVKLPELKYHTMDEFTFEVDPANYKILTQVIIAYMEKDTANEIPQKQIWYRWKYYLVNGTCYLDYGTYNGLAEPIEETLGHNTLLDEIPCRVIYNGGLTGDIEGQSDVKELVTLANNYNKTVSDFRDALRFRMFEQMITINADPRSIADMTIAPGAHIDLKTDPAADEGVQADAKMISGSFTFTEAVKTYLESTKNDMYDLMDMPKPEDIKTVPSAKALKFTFYDLIGRCEEKWLQWEPAIRWGINAIIKSIELFKLYPDNWDSSWSTLHYKLIIKHNYPIPEDEADNKKIGLSEVQNNVRSHVDYLKEFTNVEDAEAEWMRILQEQTAITATQQDQFQQGLKNEGQEVGVN